MSSPNPTVSVESDSSVTKDRYSSLLESSRADRSKWLFSVCSGRVENGLERKGEDRKMMSGGGVRCLDEEGEKKKKEFLRSFPNLFPPGGEDDIGVEVWERAFCIDGDGSEGSDSTASVSASQLDLQSVQEQRQQPQTPLPQISATSTSTVSSYHRALHLLLAPSSLPILTRFRELHSRLHVSVNAAISRVEKEREREKVAPWMGAGGGGGDDTERGGGWRRVRREECRSVREEREKGVEGLREMILGVSTATDKLTATTVVTNTDTMLENITQIYHDSTASICSQLSSVGDAEAGKEFALKCDVLGGVVTRGSLEIELELEELREGWEINVVERIRNVFAPSATHANAWNLPEGTLSIWGALVDVCSSSEGTSSPPAEGEGTVAFDKTVGADDLLPMLILAIIQSGGGGIYEAVRGYCREFIASPSLSENYSNGFENSNGGEKISTNPENDYVVTAFEAAVIFIDGLVDIDSDGKVKASETGGENGGLNLEEGGLKRGVEEGVERLERANADGSAGKGDDAKGKSFSAEAAMDKFLSDFGRNGGGDEVGGEYSIDEARQIFNTIAGRVEKKNVEGADGPRRVPTTVSQTISQINRHYPFLSLPSSSSLTLAQVDLLLKEYKNLARGVEALLRDRRRMCKEERDREGKEERERKERGWATVNGHGENKKKQNGGIF